MADKFYTQMYLCLQQLSMTFIKESIDPAQWNLD